MKFFITAALALSLTGCASIQSMIPSFWDDNQSAKIVDVRFGIDQLDCSLPQLAQVSKIRNDLRWFELYSQSKGRQQADVLRVISPMQETVEDMYNRNQTQQASKVYCELKKRVMQQQAKKAARAVLGRF